MAGEFIISNASNDYPAMWVESYGTGAALAVFGTGSTVGITPGSKAAYFSGGDPVVTMVGSSGIAKFVTSTNLLQLQFGSYDTGADVFVVDPVGDTWNQGWFIVENGTDNGGLMIHRDSFTRQTPGGFTIATNDTANTTTVITNGGTGIGSLQVEGSIVAFNGANAVPLTNGGTQQLILTGNTCEAAAAAESISVTFSPAFAAAPYVTATQTSGGTMLTSGPQFASKTNTGFSLNFSANTGTTECMDWIAIGTK